VCDLENLHAPFKESKCPESIGAKGCIDRGQSMQCGDRSVERREQKANKQASKKADIRQQTQRVENGEQQAYIRKHKAESREQRAESRK
jgi:hypothetical protein